MITEFTAWQAWRWGRPATSVGLRNGKVLEGLRCDKRNAGDKELERLEPRLAHLLKPPRLDLPLESWARSSVVLPDAAASINFVRPVALVQGTRMR